MKRSLEFLGSETSVGHKEYEFSQEKSNAIVLALRAFHIINSALFSFIPRSTSLSQLAIFTVEYALSETWKARGLKPFALLGHSVSWRTVGVSSSEVTLGEVSIFTKYQTVALFL